MKKIWIVMLLTMLFGGCKKFLEEKPNVALAVPATLDDLQALLDHYQTLNFVDGATGEISTTDFYLTDADFNAQVEENQRMYTWQKANIYASTLNEWLYNYRAIYRANSVLEYLDRIGHGPSNADVWNNLKGMAHFYRAKNLLKTLTTYAPAYVPQTAATDVGIPIRLGTDFNEKSVRESVEKGYAQVISDLKIAVELIAVQQLHVMRPNRAAANALLARTFLFMNDYANAFLFADASLKLKSDLMDFNLLSAGATFPVPQFNIEVLHDSFQPGSILSNARAKIDPQLVGMYEPNDLRSVVFLKNNGNGSYGFKGSYEGATNAFSGMATDEVYLIRAECHARMDRLPEALTDLNNLLRKRYRTNTFINIQSSDAGFVIDRILKERRKELVMRGLRWPDVKRLNALGAGIVMTRTVNGKVFTLLPNDKGYALPIPEDVLLLSGMEQNKY